MLVCLAREDKHKTIITVHSSHVVVSDSSLQTKSTSCVRRFLLNQAHFLRVFIQFGMLASDLSLDFWSPALLREPLVGDQTIRFLRSLCWSHCIPKRLLRESWDVRCSLVGALMHVLGPQYLNPRPNYCAASCGIAEFERYNIIQFQPHVTKTKMSLLFGFWICMKEVIKIICLTKIY